ncbi:hypothetical protein yc1106_03997 [Curvularia clavata]|uniref:Nicotinamide-nucleotide adenylyltransferase n=1 Tax=Curvularia clavata TaxID=95742 RepID=A0A9Q8Z9G6_CURCL|nr:hypothetical protein yc1106_03997 [Curvularia clavata]
MVSKTRIRWVLVLLHQALLVPTATAQMPYNPTRVLQSNDTLFVFRPSSKSATQFQLSTIHLSAPFSTSNLPYNTLYSTLPFLDDTTLRPFTPLIDHGGNLTVYTGDCSRGAGGAQLWTYAPDTSNGSGRGSWRQENVSVADGSPADTMGANYLSGGMTFSSIVPGNVESTGAYLFGGMCPNTSDTTSTWQSAANYSNSIVTLEPSFTNTQSLDYELDTSSSRGPPVPEAGFTITGLSPTYSDRKDGTQIQQQNFLLIGGHTSAAFINMSQIALFSLPEQGWTFIPVHQPDSTEVEPRSGHTAVLSADGQSIIVIGGWVGDIDTPAEPQHIVLNLADGYGGNGDWEWTIPSTTGAGLPTGSGLYGHGAAMLPGGVLMITGGYSIPPSGSRRRDSSTFNPQTYFLNTTSNTWIADYTPPMNATASGENGFLSTTGQKAGLGVGIGIGLLAVGGLIALCMCYRKRSQKRRQIREKQLEDLSFTTHRYNIEDYAPVSDRQGIRPDTSDYLDQNGSYYFPSGAQGGQGWKATSGGDVERTGLLVEIPSPTRGLRRSLGGRPVYAVGPPRGPSGIHPIDELEEEPDQEEAHNHSPISGPSGMAELQRKVSAAVREHSRIPELSVDTQRLGNWQEDTPLATSASHTLEAPGHIRGHSLGRLQFNSAGRISPEKSSSERTNSNLSDMSVMSWTSSNDGTLGYVLARPGKPSNVVGASLSPTNASPTHEKPKRRGELGRHSPDEPRTNSFNSEQSNGQPDMDSFRTAHSSFAHLQAEGEALLGGNPERARPGTGSSKSDTGHDTDRSRAATATGTPATSVVLDMASASPSAPRVRRMSWLGSVRRVLTRSASGAERTRSMVTPTYHEPYTDDPISPVEPRQADTRKSFPAASAPPKRAASDASFWRNRRGKKDWLDDEEDPTWRRAPGDDWGAPEDIAMAERERQRQEWRERGNLLVNIDTDDRLPTPLSPILPDQLGVSLNDGRPITPASEADWDVEAAVERRVVQVMFTVPKSKLRVVNADIDGSSVLSLPQDAEKRAPEPSSSSPSRVKDIAGRFEQMNGSKSSLRLSPRTSPRPSPSNSIKSVKKLTPPHPSFATTAMADMASRIASLRSLLPDLESALQSFTSSPAKFRVVRTVNDTPTQPKTLYILDSSFNPPSFAHFTLASSALKQSNQLEESPYRLLLLFSTHNADKAPSPASFVQRIALMTIFAEDLSQNLKSGRLSSNADISNISIDIGLTKEPYYSDKSAAIAQATPPFYASNPRHIHLVGYDTLIRFCNPKYYPKHDPPLSALKPFFDAGHKLRVTQRPTDASDESSREFGTTEEQAKYLQDLKNGKQEAAGFQPAWGDNIEMVQAEEGVGISSTRVRNAAKEGRWDVVSELCTEGVATWIKDQELYSEDASGKKMMG